MNRIAAGVALFFFLAAPALAGAIRPLQGTVIMARAGASPLFVWNATPYVAQLTTDKVFGPAGIRALEATAVTALADKARSLTASSAGIRVVYEKTGEVSAIYRTATFEGLEEVLTLTADRKALLISSGAWASALESGHTPAGLTIAVTGALPPR